MNDEMYATEEVMGTPFSCISTEIEDRDVFFGVVGKHRVTEQLDTREEVFEKLKTIDWVQICAIVDSLIEIKMSEM